MLRRSPGYPDTERFKLLKSDQIKAMTAWRINVNNTTQLSAYCRVKGIHPVRQLLPHPEPSGARLCKLHFADMQNVDNSDNDACIIHEIGQNGWNYDNSFN